MEEGSWDLIKNQQAMQPGHFEELLRFFFFKAAANCSGNIAGLDSAEHFFHLRLAEFYVKSREKITKTIQLCIMS